MANPNSSSPNLSKLKIRSDGAGSVDVALNGQELTGITSLTYGISSGNFGVVQITMIVDVDIEDNVVSQVDTIKMSDPSKDAVEL